jgi:hypothetical protein
MRSPGRSPDAGDAFGCTPPPHASEAFGAQRTSGIRAQTRFVFLLLYLVFTATMLARSHNIIAGEHQTSASSSPTPPSSPSGCEPEPPPLATVNASQLLALRAATQAVMSYAGGYGYAWGTVLARDVWADNPPESAESSRTGRRPGSFEIRQWVPDPHWGASYRDDIVADAFMFSTAAQARHFFREAMSTRCRRTASVTPAKRVRNASDLNWVNPDGATEEDVFLLRTPTVYRIVDVRPQNDNSPPSRADDQIGFTTAEKLACTLPRASCSPVRPPDKRTDLRHQPPLHLVSEAT